MPYASAKQRRFIHARAAAGEKWAQDFARDADKHPLAKKRRRRRTGSGRSRKGNPRK